VNLAYNLKLNVLVEGVETESQRDMLKFLGCHVQQAYLHSQPLGVKYVARVMYQYDTGSNSLPSLTSNE